MTARSWNSEIARRELVRLLAPGVLGFYTHFEATVVFGFPPGQREPVNIFFNFCRRGAAARRRRGAPLSQRHKSHSFEIAQGLVIRRATLS